MEQKNESERAKVFLTRHGVHESCYDFAEQLERFSSEMLRGLAGKSSSLRMLPTYLDVASAAPKTGDVIAVDAGGTNLRIALVSFAPDRAPIISRYEKYRIPGSEGTIEKDEFFSRIASYIGERTQTTDKVGFCFSFPCEIHENRDGKILCFDKEVRVNDSAGALIGVELNAALARTGKPPVKTTVLNDTSAALLGAAFSGGASGGGGYIGLIYGTGVNLCYYEKNAGMLINTEAGGYGGFPRSETDRAIDEDSNDPGEQRFEKMVSGAYFAEVALRILRLAARDGFFSPRTCAAANALTTLDAGMIDAFLRADGAGDGVLNALCASASDAALMYSILDGLYERAAKLLAICVSAALRRGGADAANPALLVAEGSMFHKGYRFRERFERWLSAFGTFSAGAPYELFIADDHVVIGAAVAAFF